jgi:hypothetical protein
MLQERTDSFKEREVAVTLSRRHPQPALLRGEGSFPKGRDVTWWTSRLVLHNSVVVLASLWLVPLNYSQGEFFICGAHKCYRNNDGCA